MAPIVKLIAEIEIAKINDNLAPLPSRVKISLPYWLVPNQNSA
jgi:hypothetical protein